MTLTLPVLPARTACWASSLASMVAETLLLSVAVPHGMELRDLLRSFRSTTRHASTGETLSQSPAVARIRNSSRGSRPTAVTSGCAITYCLYR